MPGLTSSVLPDELDTFANIADNEIEVNHVKGTDTNDDEIVLEPRRGQNEDDEGLEGEGDEIVDEDDSPAVRAAVARERKIRRDAEDGWLKQQEAADNALLNSEKSKLHTQREALKVTIDAIDSQIKMAREGLKMAAQDGDTGAKIDIEAEISRIQALRVNAEANMAKLPQESQLEDAFKKHVGDRRESVKAAREKEVAGEADENAKPLNSRAQKWAAANKGWFNTAGRKSEMETLTKIDASLSAEGYDPKTDAYFSELTKRMSKAHPKLGVKDSAGRGGVPQRQTQREASRVSQRAPVAGARTAQPAVGGQDPAKKIRVDLNDSDRSMMKKLGLDPGNEKHSQRLAKERGIRIANERAQG